MTAVDKLLDFCNQIANYLQDSSILMDRGNIILQTVKAFTKGYNKYRTSTKHHQKFKELYNSLKAFILKSEDIDEILEYINPDNTEANKNGKKSNTSPRLEIRYEGVKAYLPLSILYRNCIKISDTASKEPKESEEDFTPTLYYPEYFLYYLLGVFKECAEIESEKSHLEKLMSDLDEVLDVENNSYVDNMIGMFSMAEMFAQKTGMPMLNKNKISKEEQKRVMKEFSKAADDPKSKQAVAQIFEGLNMEDANDIPTLFTRIADNMKNNANKEPEAIKKANNVAIRDF